MSDARIEVHVIDLESPPEAVAACRLLLSAEELARADRFVRDPDRDRWTVSRGYMRAALARCCEVEAAEIVFDAEENGKPVLAATVLGRAVHFNLSHSGGLALLAVTDVAPVGVDVEFMRDISDRDAIVARFFSPAEQAAYRAVPRAEKRQAFYRGWTRKEALIKATGEGLSADLASFDVSLTSGEPARVLAMNGRHTGAAHWQMFHLRPRPGYVAAVALQSAHPVVIVTVEADSFWLSESIG